MRSPADRARLAARVCTALRAACPGSTAVLIGSLAAGTADEFSDIDVEWVLPDHEFAAGVARAPVILDGVQPVAAVRSAPDFHHSGRRRLLFVRFDGVPLFWRLNLSVRAASIAHDPDYDADNPAARAADGEWARPASALANALGAVKAVARHRFDDARGLLDRGFARIDENDRATGHWADDIARLASATVVRDPSLADVADQVLAVAADHVHTTSATRTADSDRT